MTQHSPEQIESFLAAFFGPGNEVDLHADPQSQLGSWLAPLLQVARHPSDVPVVLPRRRPDEDRRLAYVIAWDHAHAELTAELLTAFVGPSYSYFDGLPANLDAADPVEKAIIDLVGEDTSFVLRSPTGRHEASAWEALRQMQRAVDSRPRRNWHVPKPIGRLLGEFEVALAAGDNSTSQALLDQMAATGGLGGANLSNLRIKRLSRLGRDAELLELPSLSDVAAAEPPIPVRNAIFAALYEHSVATALNDNNIDAARASLMADGAAVPSDLQVGLNELSAEALWVVLLAADLRSDHATLTRLLHEPALRDRLDRHASLVAAIEAEHLAGTAAIIIPPASVDDPTPQGWIALAHAHSTADPAALTALRQETWRDWPKPFTVDRGFADAITDVDNTEAERIWQLLGPFLDADDFGHPAPHTANAFLQLALIHNWFSPADLAGIVALTETILRSSPDRITYATLLDDLGADTDRWVSADRALIVLDLADLLVRMPCPDEEARLRLALKLLGPLAAHAGRLDSELRMFAVQLDGELATALTWQPASTLDQPPVGPTLTDLPTLKVMLYSLDEAALERTRTILAELVPQLAIHTSSDHVGSQQLKQHSQRSDVVILATRCATHAATGFIRANLAPGAIIDEADGCGSASLLRAAVTALQTWLSLHHQ